MSRKGQSQGQCWGNLSKAPRAGTLQTRTSTQLAVFKAIRFKLLVNVKVHVPGGQVTVFPWGGGELARGGQPSPTEPIDWPGGLRGEGPGDRKS